MSHLSRPTRNQEFEQNFQQNCLPTRLQLLLTSSLLAATILLAACMPSTAPAAQAPELEDSNLKVSTNSDITSTSPLLTLPSGQTLQPSETITESTEMKSQAERLAKESIQLVNQARKEAGLVPLTENPILGEVAMAYSNRMATEGFYGHEDPEGNQAENRIAAADYLAQMTAENIAAGQPDAQMVVVGWLDSPGHRANMMNPDLREIGAGYAYTSTPPYQHYWTHLFATPDASVGRDREHYPELALAQINQLREQAGVAPLTMDSTAVSIANAHLQSLVQAASYENQVEQTLNDASNEAIQSFQQAVALSSAGTATPEEVVTQWVEGYGSSQLTDTNLRAAGFAYQFVEENEYRHYWLLLLVR
jgi:uncharacterized protein YkwD